MQRKRKYSGFTMAEMLITVAIIIVLSGVAFIAVSAHMRSMAQLEKDSIAKEIFVAAQNHLTMSASQGYPGVSSFGGAASTSEGVNNVYYLTYPGASLEDSSSMLAQMLPFGAIDETVRTGGTYVIRYQTDPAVVMDVIYSSSGSRYGRASVGIEDLNGIHPINGEVKKPTSGEIGFYGGDGIDLAIGDELEEPSIKVINAERLTVQVSDPNSDNKKASLQLIITGKESKANAKFELGDNTYGGRVDVMSDPYQVILDDITQGGLHFSDINQDPSIEKKASFWPGEDITVKAVASNKTELTNIAYSREITVNSLFADLRSTTDDAEKIALIGNFRHLENLDQDISGLNMTINIASQIEDLAEKDPTKRTKTKYSTNEDEDLSWDGFIKAIKSTDRTAEVSYQPISPDYELEYRGNGVVENSQKGKPHKIEKVVINVGGADSAASYAGLFGNPTEALTISDLELIDFTVSGSGDAGTLAGKLPEGSKVTNILAYHSETSTGGDAGTSIPTEGKPGFVKSSGGNAGGLIGSMDNTEVKQCAAAVIVSGSSSAGGLIGSATGGGSVTASYAGGHTEDTDHDKFGGQYSDKNYNVTATSGNAGGLIGAAGSATISNSYSTCSAKASGNVGGLVGTATGSITNCYATGLVDGGTAGAFAGSLGSGTVTGNYYYMVINEKAPSDGEDSFTYLEAVPGEGSSGTAGIKAFDEDLKTYSEFVGNSKGKATPYDKTLTTAYGETYLLKTVADLGASIGTSENVSGGANATNNGNSTTATGIFVATHYGDWPAPEILVINN